MNFYELIEKYYIYIGAFAVAFVISILMTPVSKKIAFKLKAVAYPNDRSMHSKPTALAGGIAIYAGFLGAVLLFVQQIGGLSTQLVGLLAGATVITIVGLFDDIFELRPKTRIIFQTLSALIVIFTGTSIRQLVIPFFGTIELGILSNVVTFFWIVGLTNAVNLIDGLDGLAAGVASIASVTLLVIAVLFGDPLVVGMAILLTACMSGACLGFLPYNFNPAKIFMGDTGSTFLGFSLAVISIQTMLKTYTALTLVIAIVVMALPILDTSFAIIRRAVNKKPIFQGDRGHLHHRLIDRGLSEKRAVLTLYLISGSFGIAAILIMLRDFTLALMIIGLIITFWVGDMYRARHSNQLK